MKQNTQKTTKEDLMNSALLHYEDLSNSANHWNGAIPNAIRYYYADKQKTSKKRLFFIGVGLVVSFLLGYFVKLF